MLASCHELSMLIPLVGDLCLYSSSRDNQCNLFLALMMCECDEYTFEKLLEPHELRTFTEVEYSRVMLRPECVEVS